MSMLSEANRGGLQLLADLNTFIQHLILQHEQQQQLQNDDGSLLGEDKNPFLLKVCFYVERILSDGLKDVNFIGQTYMWDFLQNIYKCLPNTKDVVELSKDCSKSACGRGRVFIRLALNDGALSGYLSALYYSQDIIKSYYKDSALFRNPEFASTFLSLLDSLSHINFNLVVKDKDLDRPQYWEDVAMSLFDNSKALLQVLQKQQQQQEQQQQQQNATTTTTSTTTTTTTTPTLTENDHNVAPPAPAEDDIDLNDLNEILEEITKEDEMIETLEKNSNSWDSMIESLARASKAVLLDYAGKASALTSRDRSVLNLYTSIEHIILNGMNDSSDRWEHLERLCANDLSRLDDIDHVNRVYGTTTSNVDMKLKALVYKQLNDNTLVKAIHSVFDNERTMPTVYSASSALLLNKKYRQLFQQHLDDLLPKVSFQLNWQEAGISNTVTVIKKHTKIIKKKVRKIKNSGDTAVTPSSSQSATPSIASPPLTVDSSTDELSLNPSPAAPSSTVSTPPVTSAAAALDTLPHVSHTVVDKNEQHEQSELATVMAGTHSNSDDEQRQPTATTAAVESISLDSFNQTLADLMRRENIQRPAPPTIERQTPVVVTVPTIEPQRVTITKAIPRSQLLSSSEIEHYLSDLVENEEQSKQDENYTLESFTPSVGHSIPMPMANGGRGRSPNNNREHSRDSQISKSFVPNEHLAEVLKMIEEDKEKNNNSIERMATSVDSYTNFHLISDYYREEDTKKPRGKRNIYVGEDDMIFINREFKKPRLTSDYHTQNCPSCGSNLEKLGFFKTRFCYYTGEWFCTNCHHNSKVPLPNRILFHWDYKMYPVSDSSKQYLAQNFNKQFDIFRFNPNVYTVSNTLNKVLELRKKLHFISEYIETCRNKSALESLSTLKLYIINENVHLYSLADLERCNNGTLEPQIFDVLEKYTHHVTKTCSTCKGKGFICEFCNTDQLLFSWMKLDIQNVIQCSKCQSLAHRKCYVKDKCPKCIRISNVKSKHAADEHNHGHSYIVG
ncbi:hypothetical protein SAMD00019534_023320 [Acytostelium subglobosum LB1]|uniref:hypothetical protein n=1 Tax=Acytostelium subglobosum LB1 TaxID=1410327 RepID=UPI0006451D12|nr:hypothetical protein SAMD00019534_023320 [Acytostelium subglobosum LB1]GAM19157.1 hypothetical protein SAMD00019534_023320 [Acytostelium subglobosum LB1]|eukprot:XP_012757084.1 hypothetical protein SAMD00019534_023320 [Acytostelium subglobosum LB1]